MNCTLYARIVEYNKRKKCDILNYKFGNSQALFKWNSVEFDWKCSYTHSRTCTVNREFTHNCHWSNSFIHLLARSTFFSPPFLVFDKRFYFSFHGKNQNNRTTIFAHSAKSVTVNGKQKVFRDRHTFIFFFTHSPFRRPLPIHSPNSNAKTKEYN